MYTQNYQRQDRSHHLNAQDQGLLQEMLKYISINGLCVASGN